MSKKFHHRPAAVILLVIFGIGTLSIVIPAAHSEASGLSEPANSEKATTLAERIKQRKDELKLVLSSDAKQKLSNKCTPAQKVISTLKTRDSSIRGKHKLAYSRIAERMDVIIAKLTKQGLSTATLSNAQQRFVDSVNQYLLDAEAYRVAINDLAALACAAEPEGFQATLLTARTQREQLAKDVVAIAVAVSEVKTALADAKKALQSVESQKTETN